MTRFYILFALLFSTSLTYSQNFTEVTAATLAFDGLTLFGDLKAANLDADSDLEYVLVGSNQSSTPIFKIYDDDFSLMQSFDGFENAKLELVDLNADNQIDILVVGVQSGTRRAFAYTNSAGVFTLYAAFDGIDRTGDMKAVNIDADANLEFIFAGTNHLGQPSFKVYDDNITELQWLGGFQNCHCKLAM